jgi:lysophospholipase L1-like esterase
LVAWGPLLALLTGLAAWANWEPPPDLARLQSVLQLLRQDPRLMWRQRERLDVEFEGTRVVTDFDGFRVGTPEEATYPVHSAGNKLVVALGASPTFGYGVELHQAWPAVVGQLLQGAFPGVKVRNAGQIGFSSWQGRQVLDEVLGAFSPHLLLVSFVENDIERLRFFFPQAVEDGGVPLPTARGAAWYNRLRALPPTAWGLRTLERLAARLAPARRARQVFELEHVRSLPATYEANLRAIIARARDRGVPVVLVVLPFRLPQPTPPQPPEVPGLLEGARAALAAGDLERALAVARDVIERDPLAGEAHYLMGRVLEARGQDDAADQAYREAVRTTVYACVRDAVAYNAIMRRVAADTGTPLADPTRSLGAEAADMRLYVKGDYIHPNPEGQRRVARCVAPLAERALRGEGGAVVNECE